MQQCATAQSRAELDEATQRTAHYLALGAAGALLAYLQQVSTLRPLQCPLQEPWLNLCYAEAEPHLARGALQRPAIAKSGYYRLCTADYLLGSRDKSGPSCEQAVIVFCMPLASLI